MADQRTGRASGRRAENQRGQPVDLVHHRAHDLRTLALLDGDRGADAGFLEQASGGTGDEGLGPVLGFLLQSGLYAAPGNEILGLDQRQNVQRAVRLHRPARGEAQRQTGLVGFVDHHQICTHERSSSCQKYLLR